MQLPMDFDILPPSDDRVFKLLLTSPEGKPVLIDLISSIINRSVIDAVVRNNEIPTGDTEEKAERFDVNCSIDDGTQIDLEMQASRIRENFDGKHMNLKGKSIYYLCDLHSSQPSKGLRRYDKLVQTYQVTFCSYTIFPHKNDYINSYSMRHDQDNELLSDAVRIIYVELSKLNQLLEKPVDELTDLEMWALFLRYVNDPNYRNFINEIIQSKEELQMAVNLLMSISQDERERAVFRSRRMYQTDLESNLATAEENGIQLGIQLGIQKGELNKAITMARSMIADGEPVEKIIKYTGLTRTEVEDLQ